jgi:hypothetical protein
MVTVGNTYPPLASVPDSVMVGFAGAVLSTMMLSTSTVELAKAGLAIRSIISISRDIIMPDFFLKILPP